MMYDYDPELAPIVPLLPTAPLDDPVVARQGLAEMLAALNAQVDTRELLIDNHSIPGPEGAPDVAIRIYRPEEMITPNGGLLHLHGGGFVVGSPDTEHSASVRIAKALSIPVISVDYRLAPENPYPAGLEDCYAALCWLHGEADALGIDRERIGIFGHSAGGGLAAGLALMARDRGGPGICFQFLGMPELDDRLETVSMRRFVDTPLWNRPNAVRSWRFYLGDDYAPGSSDVPFYAAPARATDLGNLPPAYVSAMEFDPLRDEDVLYGLKLMEAGVPVELHTFPGTYHGSMWVAEAAVTRRQEAEMLDALRRGLKLPPG
jgi:acetyl esterase